MANSKNRQMYVLQNWKLILHLLFRTYRFGVNNEWWSKFPSIFGLPVWKRWHLIDRYVEIRFRAEIGFVPMDDFKVLFPRYSRKNHE